MHTISSLKLVFGSALVALVTLPLTAGALATGKHRGGHGHKSADGHGSDTKIDEPGKASEVTRTIIVTMTDNRYSPKSITVKKGETVRFVVINKGEAVHEFNIGTQKMHAEHRKEMMMMVERGALEVDKIHSAKMNMKIAGGHSMKHDDPNSVLLEPRKSGEVIWKFSTNTKLEFACNVPGHYESGMVGKISIQ